MRHRIVPDIVKDQQIHQLPATATADAAARKMAAMDIGAIVVIDHEGHLAGLVTERDITRRAVAKGLDPKTTPLSAIMTRKIDTVEPNDTALDALEVMRVRKYRHLPVVVDGTVVAMVSVRDLYEVMKVELERTLEETEAFVFGDRYGA